VPSLSTCPHSRRLLCTLHIQLVRGVFLECAFDQPMALWRGGIRIIRTIRMQVGPHRWFGGGCDLTPNYLTAVDAETGATVDLSDDIRTFHSSWKDVCDRHSPVLYPAYKAWCDRYFFIPCRGEHRGTGGIFFDDLDSKTAPSSVGNTYGSASEGEADARSAGSVDAEAFAREVGSNILAAWMKIVTARRAMKFSDEQREWQELRRGRYIEFNLLYDRGVRFGLDGGRIESIMVSAPPRVRWKYMASVDPPSGSPEAEMLQVLQHPREWVN
jgi:coproporphyrinogen III oxidase